MLEEIGVVFESGDMDLTPRAAPACSRPAGRGRRQRKARRPERYAGWAGIGVAAAQATAPSSSARPWRLVVITAVWAGPG